MSEDGIQRVVMPKWGLSMSQGKITGWLVAEGEVIEPGAELVEVETDKIAGTVESNDQGVLRAIVAEQGQDVPVGATIAILAGASVTDEQVREAAEAARADLAAGVVVEDTGGQVDSVEVHGRRLSFATSGDAPETIVLVHGYGGDKNSWLFVQDRLSDSATVHALDLPGHGESVKDVGDGSLRTLSESVLGFLDSRGIQRAHLVGHSLGGAVVVEAAATAPDRVASLTLIAPAGFTARIDADFLRAFAAASSRRELKPQVAKLFADPHQVTRRLLEDLLKYKRLDGVTEALQTLRTTMVDGDVQALDTPARLSSSGMTPTVLWGAEDRIVPLPQDRDDRARWQVLDGAGHMLHMEHPQAVCEAVRAQLTS